MITAFIQARMSSRRFPGKVLHPFFGRPIIQHVLDTVYSVQAIDQAVVLTSDDASDQPLVDYLLAQRQNVFRGSLLNVFERYQHAAVRYPDDWILRLCADSPLLSTKVLAEVTRHVSQQADVDIVTTRFSPRFPKGQNAELIRTKCLLELDSQQLTEHDREHVTPWFYRNPDRYRIVDAARVNLDFPGDDFAVDTIEDLVRLESFFEHHPKVNH